MSDPLAQFPYPHMTTLESILLDKVYEGIALGAAVGRCSRCGFWRTDWEANQYGAHYKRNRVGLCWLCRRWSAHFSLRRPWKVRR